MRIEQIKICQFDELDERAKEKAREWYRSLSDYYEWWDAVYDDVQRAAELVGIDLKYRSGQNQKGEPTKGQPCIWFSGFSYQGDGACFEGTYSYKKGSREALRVEFPTDKALHQIVDGLYELQRTHFYRLSATVTHRGQYNHEYSTSIDTDGFGENEPDDPLVDLLRDFMRWIYRSLEREYEWINSDEAVDESIRANEYEFTESGDRWV